MYYVYILYSSSTDKYYVGCTENYEQRLIQHNTSERNTYTSKYRPWELKAVFEAGITLAEVRKWENFIKKQKSRKLIESLIGEVELNGEIAHLVRVPLVRD